MAYAMDTNTSFSKSKIVSESLDSHLPDLVCELLLAEVQRRFRSKLSVDYQRVIREESRLKGKIRVLDTIARQSLTRGKIVVEYGVLTHDTEVNRIALAALSNLSRMVSSKLKSSCRREVLKLQAAGVRLLHPKSLNFRSAYVNKSDREMFVLSKFALAMEIPGSEPGTNSLWDVDERDVWLRILFEKFLFGYFRHHLDPAIFKVQKSKTVHWQVDSYTENFQKFMPVMKTDVEITEVASNRKLIIDAKFTKFAKENQHGQSKFKSGHLYQIYTYVMSSQKEEAGAQEILGALIYPTIGESFMESANLQGHTFSIGTVNLGGNQVEISQGLDSLISLSFRERS